MNGEVWEIKSPKSSKFDTIDRELRRALPQSKNIIISSRRSRVSDIRFENYMQRRFRELKPLKRLILVKKNGDILEFGKK
ncbi:hypothetical protein FWH09_03455 [Candidatus Saccharibacteria bacterium]|nr:hypothetical protein [Candidatus Saccharibacteria bacterium]